MADYLDARGLDLVSQNLSEQRKYQDMQRKMMMQSYLDAKEKQRKYEEEANEPWRKVVAIGAPLAGMALGAALAAPTGGMSMPMGAMLGSSIGAGIGQVGSQLGMPGQPVNMAPLMQGLQAPMQHMAMQSLYDKYYGMSATPTTSDLNAAFHNPSAGLAQNPYVVQQDLGPLGNPDYFDPNFVGPIY
jgi:hypothetical protein